MNPRAILLLMIAVGTAGWLSLSQRGAQVIESRPITAAPTAPTTQVKSAPATVADASATGPNSATAPTLMELGFRGLASIDLPRPIDAGLSPSAARALHRRVVDLRACASARDPDRSAMTGDWERDTGTAWLEPAERERVRAGRRAAVARMLGACRRQGYKAVGKEFDDEPEGYVVWAIASAAASGDLGARLEAARFDRRKPDVDGVLRPLLVEAVSSRDPEIIASIGQVASRGGTALQAAMPTMPAMPTSGQRPSLPRGGYEPRALWTLVACDLGLDCGEASPTLDRMCLRDGLCGYPNVEAALRDGQITEAQLRETEYRRQWLGNRIRSGQIAGMFDPAQPLEPPQPPKPRPR